jgi:Family of unknown function (DUF5678)
MDTQVFRKNRANFSDDELRKFDGQWVAFSGDGRRIVASGETIAELEKKLVAAGENAEEVGFEHVLLDEASVGGAELG